MERPVFPIWNRLFLARKHQASRIYLSVVECLCHEQRACENPKLKKCQTGCHSTWEILSVEGVRLWATEWHVYSDREDRERVKNETQTVYKLMTVSCTFFKSWYHDITERISSSWIFKRFTEKKKEKKEKEKSSFERGSWYMSDLHDDLEELQKNFHCSKHDKRHNNK